MSFMKNVTPDVCMRCICIDHKTDGQNRDCLNLIRTSNNFLLGANVVLENGLGVGVQQRRLGILNQNLPRPQQVQHVRKKSKSFPLVKFKVKNSYYGV